MSIMSTGLGSGERLVAGAKPITITVSTACTLSGLGATKIWAFIREGKLPVTRFGQRTLIHYGPFESLLLTTQAPRRVIPRKDKAAAEPAE
jgi:excisionase family DNA binding protein